jgi:hypothetical protein
MPCLLSSLGRRAFPTLPLGGSIRAYSPEGATFDCAMQDPSKEIRITRPTGNGAAPEQEVLEIPSPITGLTDRDDAFLEVQVEDSLF